MISLTKRYTTTLGAALLVAAAVFLAITVSPVQAQQEAPALTYQNIEEGETLGAPPYVVQLCFDRPILILDLPPLDDGEFKFELLDPQNQGFGMRIVFQPDANGVGVYPGSPPAPIPGADADDSEYNFTWNVLDAETREPVDGEINFSVEEDADPMPTTDPNPCGPEGAPPVVAQVETGTPRATRTPVEGGQTDAPGNTSSPDGDPGETSDPPATGETDDDGNGSSDDDDDDDSDILLLALITIGIIGGLAVMALAGYMVRRRIGHDPHRPGGMTDHH